MQMFGLLLNSVKNINTVHATIISASLSFFMVLSLPPMVYIVILVSGIFLSDASIAESLISWVRNFIGMPAAILVRGILENPPSGAKISIISFVNFGVLLYAASRIFWQLRVSMNIIWGVIPGPVSIRARLLLILIAPVVGLVLVGAVVINAVAATLTSGLFREEIYGIKNFIWISSLLVPPGIYFGVFAAIFRFVPRINIGWRFILPASGLTAVLFWIGNYLTWSYLVYFSSFSLYGAAGLVITFLLWAYAASWIFLFGVKFLQIHAEYCGEAIGIGQTGNVEKILLSK